MATKIRLRRAGRRKQATFRIVVTGKDHAPAGRFTEQIGKYNPRTNPSFIEIDEARALHWLRQGAEASDTVRSLFRKAGIMQKLATGAEPEGVITIGDVGGPTVFPKEAPAQPETPKAEAEAAPAEAEEAAAEEGAVAQDAVAEEEAAEDVEAEEPEEEVVAAEAEAVTEEAEAAVMEEEEEGEEGEEGEEEKPATPEAKAEDSEAAAEEEGETEEEDAEEEK